MAAAAVDPPSLLLDRLAEARRQGREFADVWPAAVAAVLEPIADRVELRAWTAVFKATRPAWLAGYARESAPRSEQAVRALADLEVAA